MVEKNPLDTIMVDAVKVDANIVLPNMDTIFALVMVKDDTKRVDATSVLPMMVEPTIVDTTIVFVVRRPPYIVDVPIVFVVTTVLTFRVEKVVDTAVNVENEIVDTFIELA
jgi:hypothetical protein